MDPSSTSTPSSQTTHPPPISDELIVAGEQAIHNQVAQSSMLVSIEIPVRDLMLEYINNPRFLVKLNHLQSIGFLRLRRCRPDGNCFYRALIFAWFERILKYPSVYLSRAKADLIHCKKYLLESGFQLLVIEDFYDVAFDTVLDLERGDIHDLDMLLSRFQTDEISNAIVVLFRFITSAYLQTNDSDYLPFVLEYADTMAQFCAHHVEAMDRDADHIHISAMSNILKLNIAVAYLDSSELDDATIHRFHGDENDPNAVIYLLYRPGHYDLLYKN